MGVDWQKGASSEGETPGQPSTLPTADVPQLPTEAIAEEEAIALERDEAAEADVEMDEGDESEEDEGGARMMEVSGQTAWSDRMWQSANTLLGTSGKLPDMTADTLRYQLQTLLAGAVEQQQAGAAGQVIEGPLLSISDRQYRVQLQAISQVVTGRATTPLPPATEDSLLTRAGTDLAGMDKECDSQGRLRETEAVEDSTASGHRGRLRRA